MDKLVKYIERHNEVHFKLERLFVVQNTTSILSSGSSHPQLTAEMIQQLETKVINGTTLTFSTLGSAGCRALECAKEFDVVVIDEAAQSSELSSLLALQLGSSHAVLIGDPQQLPATIFSLSGRMTKYDRSLFQRLEEAGHPVHMLNLQYRCNPMISSFTRKIFYGGSLLDGPNVQRPDYGGLLSSTIRSRFPNLKVR